MSLNYSQVHGSIRLIVSKKYLKDTGEVSVLTQNGDLDAYFKNLTEYLKKVEKYLNPMERTILFPQIQDYFFKNMKTKDWESYLKNHPDELLKTIKYNNRKIVAIDVNVTEEGYKKLFDKEEIVTPQDLATKISDIFYKYKNYIQKVCIDICVQNCNKAENKIAKRIAIKSVKKIIKI